MTQGYKAGTLAHERGKRGWTQVELAERAGIHQTLVSRVENGATVRAGNARKIAKAFGCSLKVSLSRGILVQAPTRT